jgi:hypothetical protein
MIEARVGPPRPSSILVPAFFNLSALDIHPAATGTAATYDAGRVPTIPQLGQRNRTSRAFSPRDEQCEKEHAEGAANGTRNNAYQSSRSDFTHECTFET